jgi:hypothetical protein
MEVNDELTDINDKVVNEAKIANLEENKANKKSEIIRKKL